MSSSVSPLSKLRLPLRGVFGLYEIDSAEEQDFDPTIRQNYDRLRSNFLLLRPPCAKDLLPASKLPVKIAPDPLAQAPASEPTSITQIASVEDLRYLEDTYKRGKTLIEEMDKDRCQVTNAVLYEIESIIIALSNLEALRQGYQNLQDRFRELAGAEVFKDYLNAQRPNVAGSNEIGLYRADSLFLSGQIRRYNILIPRREQIRRWLLIDVLGVTLLAAVGITLSIVLQSERSYFPLLRLTSIAALLGGLTSVLQRIQSIPEDQVSLSLWNRISVVLGPLTAIVFALLLYEIFEANFVSGTFFPNIGLLYSSKAAHNAATAGQDRSLYDLFATLSHTEFAKLIVWSFIAGFSERFVPDTLNGLIERQKTATNK